MNKICILLVIAFVLTGCVKEDKVQTQYKELKELDVEIVAKSKDGHISIIEINDHTYVSYWGRIVHDPDCQCKGE